MKTKGSTPLRQNKKLHFTNKYQYLIVIAMLATGACSSLDRHNPQDRHTRPLDRHSPLDRHTDKTTLLGGQAQIFGPNRNKQELELAVPDPDETRSNYITKEAMDGSNENPAPGLMASDSLDQLKPQTPYRIRVIKPRHGSRATAARGLQRCPSGSLRYCDHRVNRCSCVSSSKAQNILRNRSGF